MKKPILLILLMFVAYTNAQLYVVGDTTIEVDNARTLYSNIPIVNNGIINLNDGSILEFDDNFTNDGVVNYELGSTPGILRIGSGITTVSEDAQTLQFSGTATENIPLIELNKASNTATITRGNVRLTQRLLSTSGTLDANSAITDTPAVNTTTGLTFISPDATTTAVIEESTGGSVENVIIERFIPESNRAFRLFSSSVDTNDGSIKDNLQEGGQIDNWTGPNNGLISDPRPGFGTHITGVTIVPGFPNSTTLPAAQSSGLDITNTGNPGMYVWDPAAQQFDPLTDSNGGMSFGNAYLLFIRGDRSLDLSANNTQVGNQTTLRMLGDALVGPIGLNYNVENPSDLIFIANPYQAQVDMLEVFANAGTNEVNTSNFSVFDPKLGLHGGFVTVDLTTTPVSNTLAPLFPDGSESSGSSPANEFLQPNQSIFVTTLAASATPLNPVTATVAFEENDKRDANQNTTIDIFSEDTDVKLYVTLFNVDDNAYNDNVLVRYGNYNDEYANEDGLKFWNQYENIAVQNPNNFTNLEKRDINGNMDNILLNINNLSQTNYQIITSITNVQDLQNAYLIDHYLDTETELAEGDNYYNFSIDNAVPASFDENRFEIGINMETLSTNNPGAVTEFSLYPNPATTSVDLTLSGLADNFESVDVVSVDGKLVKTIQLDNLTRYTMDISSLASGVYVLKATTANSSFTQKLIIE